MRNLFLLLLFVFSISSFSQKTTETFSSTKLNEDREIIISLPPSYEKNINKKYPLLVLLDGDYLLDTFQGTLNYGAYWDDLPEVIIVGISQNKKNERETDCTIDEETGLPTGKGIDFINFIGQELMPYIQKKYRIAPFKIIAGHDTTAAFLNFFLYVDQPIFDAYISLSPELTLGMDEQLPGRLEALKSPLFYYLSTADGDVPEMQERIKKIDNAIKTTNKASLNYQYEYFKGTSHYSLVLHSIPTALYQLFAVTQPISTIEYDEKISKLPEGYVDYLAKKYEVIEQSFGIKMPIRLNDFNAIQAAILQNKAYNELDALAILADKSYPKSMLGDYQLALMFESKGDNPRAVRYYMSAFNKDEIGDLTKTMVFDKAEELKKTYAKKPKGKKGEAEEAVIEETIIEAPVTEEKKP